MVFKFLFLLSKTTELRLSHFNVAPLVLAVAVVAFSRAKMDLADAVVLSTTATFLNHSVSEIVEEVGEFEAAVSACTVTNNRHRVQP